ncbi:MAG TPA: cell division/cell wall cluster transcriptional repressor MraZ, partial [Firmicutes bacterium]|nr:cell division/cell wall cluster transcriptional repressor MraZ [Bacillota bacterium]
LEEKLRGLPLTRADARSFVRLLFSGAVECEPDKQGRVWLPPNLRSHARLEKDVYLLGVSNRVEIWDKEIWEQYSSQAAASFEEAAEQLEGLGI